MMYYPDEFVNQYRKFLVHKNATGEKVPNLDSQVADFKNAVDYANSILDKKNFEDFTTEEFLDFILQTHKRACPSLYKTLPKTKIPESPGDFRCDDSLELIPHPESHKYYTGIGSENIFEMTRFLRHHEAVKEADIGIEFLSGYYKLLWSRDFDETQRAVFKRRVTMDYLTKDMNSDDANRFLVKYAVISKQPNPPKEWALPYSEVSSKLDSPVTELEKSAVGKIFWIRDCISLKERTLQFCADFLDANRKGVDPIEIFARFSRRFIHIHPFLNGNSRDMHIILNLTTRRAKLPYLFLGNIFPTRDELYVNYFHPVNEDDVLPKFIDALRDAVSIAHKEERLHQKSQSSIKLPNGSWKIYPRTKQSGNYIGHRLCFFTFSNGNSDDANKLVEDLQADGFDAQLKSAPSGNPSIIVDLTNSK